MSDYKIDFKRKAGAILTKLKKQDRSLSEEDLVFAKFHAGTDIGLAKYFGPEQSPKFMDISTARNQMMLAALSHYQLTGRGEGFVQRHSEEQLSAGRFLFPGEPP